MTGETATAAAAAGSSTTEEQLNDLLSSSTFSVPSYLNLALSGGSSDPELLQRRMAELALQLQLQTQSCHEDIGRIGAELQAILPRCAADVGRLGVGLEGMVNVSLMPLHATLCAHKAFPDYFTVCLMSTVVSFHLLDPPCVCVE
jgi:hypothetical protein